MTHFFYFLRGHFFADKTSATDLRQWREEVFSAVLLATLMLGLVAAIPSILAALKYHLYLVVVIDIIALCWIVVIGRMGSWSYQFRVVYFLTILFLLGVFFLFLLGSVGQLYLVAVPVMAALLLGLRSAVYCLIINAITIFFLGFTYHLDIQLPGLDDQAFLRWTLISINLSVISSVITISCAVLLQRLEGSLKVQGDVSSALRSANEELRLISAVVAQLNDIVMISKTAVNPGEESRIVFVNHAFERRTGYRSTDVIGADPKILHGINTQKDELERISRAMEMRESIRTELINYTSSGEEFWLEENIQVLTGSDDGFTHHVTVGRDITERKKANADIYSLAYFDVLTGLPNRRLLLERIKILLIRAQNTSSVSAVFFIDLDHFKYINDARGHVFGDVILTQVASRLTEVLPGVDTVARIGGDEFVVLISNIASNLSLGADIALATAEKIRAAIAQPFEVTGKFYDLSCSIGVTLLPRNEQCPDDLLRESDTAMNRAKAAGRNQIAFFEESMQTEVQLRLEMLLDLAGALEKNQIQMHLQVQVDHAGLPIGGELLMRWTHPDRGIVSPAVFIPLAEESGVILRLGEWAMLEGCLTSVQLGRRGWRFPLSINVSPKQFRQADFVDKVRMALATSGAQAGNLIFEVTEGLLIDNLQETIGRMQDLCELGIRFSIDDFGTGYSSLYYLKRLPLYELKIDKSFVQDTPGDPNDTAIVKSILAMAKHLGLRVVAEGVETCEQADFLIASGCDSLQGYLFSYPMPVERWLEQKDATPLT